MEISLFKKKFYDRLLKGTKSEEHEPFLSDVLIHLAASREFALAPDLFTEINPSDTTHVSREEFLKDRSRYTCKEILPYIFELPFDDIFFVRAENYNLYDWHGHELRNRKPFSCEAILVSRINSGAVQVTAKINLSEKEKGYSGYIISSKVYDTDPVTQYATDRVLFSLFLTNFLIKQIVTEKKVELIEKKQTCFKITKGIARPTAKPSKYTFVNLNPKASINPIPITHDDREYSHRWEVRGHWRKTKMLGKDPEGNLIEGKTWIRDHVRGPVDKVLIKKVRVLVGKREHQTHEQGGLNETIFQGN